MTSAHYIEFDSTYRNRGEWPLASDFIMPISQTGRKNKVHAVDPVANAAPLTAWTSNRVDANTSGVVLTGVIDAVAAANNIAATTGQTQIILTSAAGNFQQAEDYYQRLVLVDTTVVPNERRRIAESRYLGTDTGGTNDRMIVRIESAFSNAVAPGDAFSINDPTDLSNTSVPLIYVPSGEDAANSYATYYLYNETLNQFRRITGYGALTHLVELDAATNPVTGWLATHNYSIRIGLPVFTDTTAGGSTTTVVLTTGSSVDNFYNNDFVRIKAAVYGNAATAPETESRRIVAYDGATQTITVSPPFSAAVVAVQQVEILEFSYDNLFPFTYSGSTVSQQEMVCYEIELLNLVLPNSTMTVGGGARVSFYPYVYVEISNVNAAETGMKYTIYSNNPNAQRAVFRAAIDDVPNPIITPFIKIDGDGMVQTIKFKPNDNLRIRITLPGGELYQTVITEQFSPLPPASLGQISGVFKIKRLG